MMDRMKRILVNAAVFVIAAVVAVGAAPAHAQKLSFIRDAEIENTIREFAIPVFRAAQLDPAAIKIYLVQDNTINAFVAGGQRLFINTGLLTKSTNAGQIIGVIAHETGHIAGGHLARIQDALQNSTATTILSLILGGAAIGAGRGDLAGVIVVAGQGISMRNLLQYTRTQESSADQAGLKYLETAGLSAKGLLEFMDILGDQELLQPEQQDPYVLTHPLTRDRIAAIADYVSRSPLADKPLPAAYEVMHARMKAKLYAFLNKTGGGVCLFGSHNLTVAGSATNDEAGVMFVAMQDASVRTAIQACRDHIVELACKGEMYYDSMRWPVGEMIN